MALPGAAQAQYWGGGPGLWRATAGYGGWGGGPWGGGPWGGYPGYGGCGYGGGPWRRP